MLLVPLQTQPPIGGGATCAPLVIQKKTVVVNSPTLGQVITVTLDDALTIGNTLLWTWTSYTADGSTNSTLSEPTGVIVSALDPTTNEPLDWDTYSPDRKYGLLTFVSPAIQNLTTIAPIQIASSSLTTKVLDNVSDVVIITVLEIGEPTRPGPLAGGWDNILAADYSDIGSSSSHHEFSPTYDAPPQDPPDPSTQMDVGDFLFILTSSGDETVTSPTPTNIAIAPSQLAIETGVVGGSSWRHELSLIICDLDEGVVEWNYTGTVSNGFVVNWQRLSNMLPGGLPPCP